MNTALYVLGTIAILLSLVMAAHLLHVPQAWIAVGVILFIGIALLNMSKRRRI